MTLTLPEIQAAGGYEVVYADPPWSYNDKGINGAADKHYPTMSFRDLCTLPIGSLTAKDAVLFMWGVFPMTPEAMTLMVAWGFRFKTGGFTWVKTLKSGDPMFGLGRWTRGSVEPCWLGVKGHPHWMVENMSVRQALVEEFPSFQVGQHSAKPPQVRTRIETLLGDRARLELFARTRTPGWDVWGNEVESDVDLGLKEAA